MRLISTYLGVGLLAVAVMLVDQRDAEAQYPYTINAGATYVAPVQAYAPAVVGYTAERRGLFGRRTLYRPVLGPAVAQPVSVVAPVETVTQATSSATVPITSARPVLQASAVYQAPLAAATQVVSPFRRPTGLIRGRTTFFHDLLDHAQDRAPRSCSRRT